jgi:predicted RNA-binding protein with PUA domain
MIDARQSAVEASEDIGRHEGDEQEARAEDEDVLVLAKIEGADATDEQIGDGQVECAPEYID